MKKILCIVLALVLVSNYGFADVSGKVTGYKKIVVNNKPLIEVSMVFTYPDGTKKSGKTIYSYSSFNRDRVVSDINTHCETIIKYYIGANKTAMDIKEEEIVDYYVSIQHSPVEEKFSTLYVDELDITLQTDGEISENYK